MDEKLPIPCERCKGTGVFQGATCDECGGKGYRLIVGGRLSSPTKPKTLIRQPRPHRRPRPRWLI